MGRGGGAGRDGGLTSGNRSQVPQRWAGRATGPDVTVSVEASRLEQASVDRGAGGALGLQWCVCAPHSLGQRTASH